MTHSQSAMESKRAFWSQFFSGWWSRRRYEASFIEALDAYVDVFQAFRNRVIPIPCSLSATRFDWNQSMNVGATASRFGKQRDIRVSLGCWSRVQDISSLLMACGDIMPWFGEANQETGTIIGWMLAPEQQPQEPLSASRMEAAHVLAEMTLMMIFMHELGHHVLGHLDLQATQQKASIVETKQLWLPWQDQSRTIKLAQWHEVCADRFAVDGLKYQINRYGEAFPGQILGEDLRSHLSRVVPLAHLIMLLSLPGYDVPLGRYDFAEHPHPLVRVLASQSYPTPGENLTDEGGPDLVQLLKASYYANLSTESWKRLLEEAHRSANECLAYQPKPNSLGILFDLSQGRWKNTNTEDAVNYSCWQLRSESTSPANQN